jgi:hypothetical protein
MTDIWVGVMAARVEGCVRNGSSVVTNVNDDVYLASSQRWDRSVLSLCERPPHSLAVVSVWTPLPTWARRLTRHVVK